jgi:hypothetical protein
VGLERGPLSFVSATEELTGRKCSGSCLEIREYGLRDPLCRQRNTFYSKKLALTSPTRDGLSVVIVCSRTKTTEFVFCLFIQSRDCAVGIATSYGRDDRGFRIQAPVRSRSFSIARHLYRV